MKTITKYRLCQIRSNNINGDAILSLANSEGRKDVCSYETEFDTKEKAIQFAMEWNEHSNYAILEVFSFEDDND